MIPGCEGCPECGCLERCDGHIARWCDACAVHLLAKYVEASELAADERKAYMPTDEEHHLLVALRDLLLDSPHRVLRAFQDARADRRHKAVEVKNRKAVA